jgi:anthranilate phosphoribosyltransferase
MQEGNARPAVQSVLHGVQRSGEKVCIAIARAAACLLVANGQFEKVERGEQVMDSVR